MLRLQRERQEELPFRPQVELTKRRLPPELEVVQPERHHLVEAFQRPEKFQQCEVRGRQEVEDGQLKREQLPDHRGKRDADKP